MSRPAVVGGHVKLRESAIPRLATVYGALGVVAPDALWLVEVIDTGYHDHRGALHLVDGQGMRIVAWRGDVIAEPRCDYCGAEGHSKSTGTAKTCSLRAEQAEENRLAASARMKARWAAKKAAALPSAPF